MRLNKRQVAELLLADDEFKKVSYVTQTGCQDSFVVAFFDSILDAEKFAKHRNEIGSGVYRFQESVVCDGVCFWGIEDNI